MGEIDLKPGVIALKLPAQFRPSEFTAGPCLKTFCRCGWGVGGHMVFLFFYRSFRYYYSHSVKLAE
jgi:hypothetical protein